MSIEYGYNLIDYGDGNEIPTTALGDGSVGVSAMAVNEEGFAGVGFWPLPEPVRPGTRVAEEKDGETADKLGIYMQLLFDNPASIDSVISLLEDAKNLLLDQNANAHAEKRHG